MCIKPAKVKPSESNIQKCFHNLFTGSDLDSCLKKIILPKLAQNSITRTPNLYLVILT